MVYEGVLLYQDKSHSFLLDIYPKIQTMHPKIMFHKSSFSEFSRYMENLSFFPHILLIEVLEEDSSTVWFPLLQDVLFHIPYCRIIFILEGRMDHCSFFFKSNSIYLYFVTSFHPYIKYGIKQSSK